MKAYFMCGPYEGCNYTRCILPSGAGGWGCNRAWAKNRRVGLKKMVEDLANANVVVFQRPVRSVEFNAAKALKSVGKKIVLDIDDTYDAGGGALQPTSENFETKRKINSVLKTFAGIADLVTVSSRVLAEEYGRFHKRVAVLPNCVDPGYWGKPSCNNKDEVRLGLVGSVVASGDFKKVKALLEKVAKWPGVKLVVFAFSSNTGNELNYWKKIGAIIQPLVPFSGYPATLNKLKLDIMLIPRKDTYFNRCRSNIKFLESSMLEIPVIAQGFSDSKSPYQNLQDRSFMKICNTNSDWENAVSELIKNKQLRRDMGKLAKTHVLKTYNIYNNIWLWQKAYESLLE